MKIAHIVETFSPLSETFIYDKIIDLDNCDTDNVVMAYNFDNSQRVYENTIALDHGGESIWFKLKYLFNRVLRRREYLRFLKLAPYNESLIRHIQIEKPDIIFAHFGPIGFLALPLARSLNVPIVVNFYGYDISQLLQSKYWVSQYHKGLGEFDGIIGISTFICSKLLMLNAPEENIKLIRLGVNESFIKNTYPAERISKSVVKCLHIGRLVEKKSPINLIESFCVARKLVEDRVDLKLQIIGDGPLMEACESLIELRKLEENVELLGSLTHDDSMALLRKSHIYVQHSVTAKNGDQEGQGVSLVEATALGLPIVTTRHNGFPDVVVEGVNGFLVDEGDFEAMGERIAFLAENHSLWNKMGENGIKHVQSNYINVNEAIKTKEYFEEIVQRS